MSTNDHGTPPSGDSADDASDSERPGPGTTGSGTAGNGWTPASPLPYTPPPPPAVWAAPGAQGQAARPSSPPPPPAALPQPYGQPAASAAATGGPAAAAGAFPPPTNPYGYPAYGPPAPAAPTASGKAVTSLVASLIYACGIGSIVGIVTGHLAWRDINRSQGRLNGKPLAVIGMVLGYVGLAVTLVVGGDLALTALSENSPNTNASPQQPAPSETPSPPSPNDIGTPCPAAALLDPVTPPNTEFNLGALQRNETTGVLICIYGQPAEPNGGLTVLVELQDSEAIATVDQYFAERELTPPTAAQLGASGGQAERFGIDEYTLTGTDIPYRDTAAARGNLAAYLSVPQEWNIPITVQFEATVALLNDIGVGSGAGSTGPGGTSPTV